jgi:hypothetical protein
LTQTQTHKFVFVCCGRSETTNTNASNAC